jgi:hypothetical protein
MNDEDIDEDQFFDALDNADVPDEGLTYWNQI